jgi:tetratricopeptide (TPR) repeat protein
MMEGDSAYSVQSANETVNSIPKDYLSTPAPLGNYMQYIYMTPVLVHVRFGNWKELLLMKQPDKTQVYSNVLYHFGRGMAFTHQSKQTEARKEQEMMRQLMKDSSLAIPMTPFSAVIEGCIVAENLLEGSMALAEKKYIDAVTAFSKAVTTEENMVYTEPRDWLLNPKHYLGNAYLQAKKFPAARQVFQNDLQYNNENGWALFGLYNALQGEKKKTEAQKTWSRFKKAFAKADIELNGPVRL